MEDLRFDYFSSNIITACESQRLDNARSVRDNVENSNDVQEFLNEPR